MIKTKIKQAIQHARKILITSHINPDGDAIGSLLALYLALLKMNKQADPAICSPIPKQYNFLPQVKDIQICKEYTGQYDLMIALDCGDASRIGKLAMEVPPPILNIDHHKSSHPFGQINWFSEAASAASEMVYELILELGVPIDRDIAACIYTGIATDTGNFRYSNTSSRCLHTAGRLVELGADPYLISQQIYENVPPSTLKLLNSTLSTLEISFGGQLGNLTVTQQMLKDAGAQSWEAENFVNYARSIEGVRVAMLVYEKDSRECRVSLRSKDEIDVAEIARHFGGGGHFHAAGITMQGSVDQTRAKVQDWIGRNLFSNINGGKNQ